MRFGPIILLPVITPRIVWGCTIAFILVNGLLMLIPMTPVSATYNQYLVVEADAAHRQAVDLLVGMTQLHHITANPAKLYRLYRAQLDQRIARDDHLAYRVRVKAAWRLWQMRGQLAALNNQYAALANRVKHLQLTDPTEIITYVRGEHVIPI